MAVAYESFVTIQAQELQMVASVQFRKPNLNLIDHTDKYLRFCVPLRKAALKGNWKAAKHILDQDRSLACAAITKGWSTVLHVAARANHVHFVDELVKEMNPEDLELQDVTGNTAFSIAAATGNLDIVEIMKRKNKDLPLIRGSEGTTALHMAALQGQRDMAWHLYPETIQAFHDQTDWIILLFCCVNSEIYDLALKCLEMKQDLAFERDDSNDETILHILVRKPLSSICQSQRYRKRLMKSWECP